MSAPSNFSTNLSKSLANLVTTILDDHAIVATLTDTVAKLSAELASIQTKLVSSLLKNQQLLKRISGQGHRNSGDTGGRKQGGNISGGEEKEPWSDPPIHYCLKHGFNYPHPSLKCPGPAANHVKNVTTK